MLSLRLCNNRLENKYESAQWLSVRNLVDLLSELSGTAYEVLLFVMQVEGKVFTHADREPKVALR
jgi:hypothetical protein